VSSFGLQIAKICSTHSRVASTRPIAVAVSHRDIDVFANEIDVMHGRRNPQVDAGMRCGEARQAMHQPFRGKIQRGTDREHVGALPLHQPLRAGADVVERLADHNQIVAAGGGDLEALALAVE
jgi:hypothetical protein